MASPKTRFVRAQRVAVDGQRSEKRNNRKLSPDGCRSKLLIEV